MTTSSDEYGDLIRRAMRAEADSVVPSPQGLDIIRHRIEHRGIRSIIWWRVGAALTAAAVVAGTVVMSVPELRDNVTATLTGGNSGEVGGPLPGLGSTHQPPPPTEGNLTVVPQSPPPEGEIGVAENQLPTAESTPGGPTPEPCATPSPTPTPTPTPSPTIVEPNPSGTPCPPGTAPVPTTTPGAPVRPKPTPPPAAQPSPSPTPTTCGADCATSTPDPPQTQVPEQPSEPASASSDPAP